MSLVFRRLTNLLLNEWKDKEESVWAGNKGSVCFKNTDGHVRIGAVRVRERLKDTDGLTEVLQVPVDGPQTVPQLIGAPVQLVTTHLRTRQSTDTHLLQIRCKHCAQTRAFHSHDRILQLCDRWKFGMWEVKLWNQADKVLTSRWCQRRSLSRGINGQQLNGL